MLDTQNCLQYDIKNAKRTKFFYSHVVLPNDTPAKFILSATFGLSFMRSSAAPNRSSTFYTYLNIKNLKSFRI